LQIGIEDKAARRCRARRMDESGTRRNDSGWTDRCASEGGVWGSRRIRSAAYL